MASTADDEKRKGKRPMSPEEEVAYATAAAAAAAAAAEAEVKPSSSSVEGKGEKPSLLLVAEDGVEVRVSEPAARLSLMLRHMIEDDCAKGPIRIPAVYGDVLEMLVEYCEKHAPHYDPEAFERERYPFPPFPVELPPTASSIKPVTYVDPDADPHGLKAWDKEFLSVDNSTLFEIILAANYMNVEDLLDLGCRTVADKMKGRTPEEIRDIFEIENDYTLEQEDEVRKENAWAFED